MNLKKKMHYGVTGKYMGRWYHFNIIAHHKEKGHTSIFLKVEVTKSNFFLRKLKWKESNVQSSKAKWSLNITNVEPLL